MIPIAIARYHELVTSKDPRALDLLLAEDVVFHSPVVHTPQVGKSITTKYLTAAISVFFNASFRFTRECYADRAAVFEFLVDIDGILVNGVDIIAWNDDDQIVEFKVMIRPLKAVQKVHQKMAEVLATMG
jgi:hypothetical protein